jgi:hypothetical protein
VDVGVGVPAGCAGWLLVATISMIRVVAKRILDCKGLASFIFVSSLQLLYSLAGIVLSILIHVQARGLLGLHQRCQAGF